MADVRCLLAMTLLASSVTATVYVRDAAAAGFPVSSTDLTVTARSETVPTQTCSLGATADTYTDEQNSLSNYGTTADVRVGAKPGQRKRAFVMFDLAPCAIAPGAVVSASLRLTIGAAPSSTRTYDVFRLTSAFSELALTWGSTQPTLAAAPSSSVSTGTSNGATLQWDVTADVASFAASPVSNFGWTVRDSDESGGTAFQTAFRAREHGTVSQRPALVITYYP
jgi:hypothetical protein